MSGFISKIGPHPIRRRPQAKDCDNVGSVSTNVHARRFWHARRIWVACATEHSLLLSVRRPVVLHCYSRRNTQYARIRCSHCAARFMNEPRLSYSQTLSAMWVPMLLYDSTDSSSVNRYTPEIGRADSCKTGTFIYSNRDTMSICKKYLENIFWFNRRSLCPNSP